MLLLLASGSPAGASVAQFGLLPIMLSGSSADPEMAGVAHFGIVGAGDLEVTLFGGTVSFGIEGEAGLYSITPGTQFGIVTSAILRARPAVVVPPPNFSLVKRASLVMSTPTLDSMGRPVDWIEDSVVNEEWGRLQVVFNGVDVTFYRNVPTQVTQVEFTEPFSDSVAVIKFPQFSPFEALPSWLNDFVNVEINQVKPDGSVETIWEGLYASEEDAVQNNAEFTAECIGALYQADLFRKQPSFDIDTHDMGEIIATLINDKITHHGLRLAYMGSPNLGILALNRGAWQPLLTGYIQELLAGATTATDLGAGFAVGIGVANDGEGYWITGSLGHVIPFDENTPYYGSMAHQYLNRHMTGMAVRPQGDGYWLVAEDGGVFAFGAAGFYGSRAGLPLNEVVTDIEPTPTGLGYWLVARDGGVFAYGDAIFYGSGLGVVTNDVESITATPSGLGYFIASLDGNVYAFGDAVFNGNPTTTVGIRAIVAIANNSYWVVDGLGNVEAFGSAVDYGGMGGIPLNGPIRDMISTPTGLGYWFMGTDGGVFSFGDAQFHGSIPGGSGVAHQWTMHKDDGRIPVLRLKDRITLHWSVTVGTPGVKHSLSRDFTMTPNALFAEGTAPDGCHWRNTRYPIMANLDSAFFLPLAYQPEVEPYLYDADGVVTGNNPYYDPSRVRVEGYSNLGDMVSRYEGLQSVRADLYRNSSPKYQGTITLEIDPEEGSRFNIREGQNILLKGYRGQDELFHIAKVGLNFNSLTAELTVDQKSQDLLTLSAVESRDRATVEASKSFKPTRRNSVQVEDRAAVFDCESGAGILRAVLADNASGWFVWQVPFAERGQVIKTSIEVVYVEEGLDPQAVAMDFTAAIFNRPITVSELTSKMPTAIFGVGAKEWDDADTYLFDDDLVIAWGGVDEPAGYSPDTSGPTPSGRLWDDAQWYYMASKPPWLWVAMYINGNGINLQVHGNFTPGSLMVS